MTLPDPPGWKNQATTTAIFIAVILAFGAWSAVWTVIYLGRGDVLTTVVTAMATVSACTLAVLLTQTGLLKSVRINASHISPYTTLQPSRSLEALSRTFGITVAISCLLFAVCAPRGDLAFQLAGGQRIFLPIAIGGIGLIALVQLIRSAKSGHSALVRFSPGQLVLDNGYSRLSPAWGDITEISSGTPRSGSRHLIVVATKDGPSATFNSASWLTPGGVAIYWMIRHYWKHPEDRAELTDGRALDRLRDQQFDTT